MSHKSGASGAREKRTRGNTNPRPNQCKRWCFTFNNYNQEDYTNLIKTFTKMNIGYIIGEEVGANGTPHLQGYIECPI